MTHGSARGMSDVTFGIYMPRMASYPGLALTCYKRLNLLTLDFQVMVVLGYLVEPWFGP